MDKIDKLIEIVRTLKEEGGMTTGSSGPVAGFSSMSNASGPVAGQTPVLPKLDGRSKIMRRLPSPYKRALQKTKK
jgi:hypothetical protein